MAGVKLTKEEPLNSNPAARHSYVKQHSTAQHQNDYRTKANHQVAELEGYPPLG